ncbi:MAG TPA: FHA domain-containing protein [Thermoanaerobaculia bacterium]
MTVAFGGFRLDGDARRLERNGDPVPLTPKAFRLLEILVAERPRPLRKEDLCERLWPDAVVEQGNVASLVAEIRGALAAAGGDPDVIRTVRRFGYSFDGRAVAVESAETPSPETLFFLLTREGRIHLKEGTNVLGRDYDSIVRLQSASVSRRHAQIFVACGEATLEDLGSRNGTFVGTTRVAQPTPLRGGERIVLGSELAGTVEAVAPPGSTIGARNR